MTVPDPQSPSPPPTTPLMFDAVLQPHRSLGRRGFLILMLLISGISFAAGLAFLLIGAWPVFGFFGLDVLAIYVAFRLSYRSGRLVETVQLSETELRVSRRRPSGRSRSWTFAPNWLRVGIDNPPAHDSQITLSSHGKSVTVGSFLTPDERLDFALALREALARWRTREA